MVKRGKLGPSEGGTDVREPLETPRSGLPEGGGEDQREGFQRSGLSEGGGEDQREGFQLLADAIDVIHGEPRFLGGVEARLRVEREISRRLFATGFPPKEMIRIEPQLEAAAWEIVEYIAGTPTITPEDGVMNEQIDMVVDYLTRVYTQHLEKFPDELFSQAAKVIEDVGSDGVEYRKLPKGIVTLLEERLREEGMSEADRAKFIQSTMANFQGAAVLSNPEQAKAAVDLMMAAVRATRGAAVDFGEAAKLALPERAPEIWMERDRGKGETPVAFLNRVWGPWMEAGVLYQDDIKRLGDPDLVKTIRTFCVRQGLKASAVLPPPQKARLERALMEVEPGSQAEALVRERLSARERAARRHRELKTKA